MDTSTPSLESFRVGPGPARYLHRRYRVERVVALVSAPLWMALCACVAAAIKMDSRGPALFLQQRPGIGASTFVIIKFRTMFVEQCGTGVSKTARNDPRVTRLGHMLRRTHLDEVPQLWNVLRGEMSIIGPRPEPMPNTEEYERALRAFPLRRAVRPGITGWAQVQLGYTGTVEAARRKLEFDLQYIRNASPRLDASILWRTLREAIRPRVSW